MSCNRLFSCAFKVLRSLLLLACMRVGLADTGLAPAILDLALVFRGQRPSSLASYSSIQVLKSTEFGWFWGRKADRSDKQLTYSGKRAVHPGFLLSTTPGLHPQASLCRGRKLYQCRACDLLSVAAGIEV